MKNCLSVGRITGLFGNNGELTLRLYDNPTELNIKEPLFVEIDTLAVPLFVRSFKRKGQNGAVVTFDDIDTIRRAEELIGMELYARAEDAPTEDDGELYIEDLGGFAFVAGDVKGTIKHYIESELNPLFLVTIAGVEHFIPAVEDFIDFVDENKRIVVFNLPEGLLEINAQQ